MWDTSSPEENLKMCFAKPRADYGAQIVADGAVKTRNCLPERPPSRGHLERDAGAHPGGNLRVRAFFISYFLSQE
jgi:hypothetical protein